MADVVTDGEPFDGPVGPSFLERDLVHGRVRKVHHERRRHNARIAHPQANPQRSATVTKVRRRRRAWRPAVARQRLDVRKGRIAGFIEKEARVRASRRFGEVFRHNEFGRACCTWREKRDEHERESRQPHRHSEPMVEHRPKLTESSDEKTPDFGDGRFVRPSLDRCRPAV